MSLEPILLLLLSAFDASKERIERTHISHSDIHLLQMHLKRELKEELI